MEDVEAPIEDFVTDTTKSIAVGLNERLEGVEGKSLQLLPKLRTSIRRWRSWQSIPQRCSKPSSRWQRLLQMVQPSLLCLSLLIMLMEVLVVLPLFPMLLVRFFRTPDPTMSFCNVCNTIKVARLHTCIWTFASKLYCCFIF